MRLVEEYLQMFLNLDEYVYERKGQPAGGNFGSTTLKIAHRIF